METVTQKGRFGKYGGRYVPETLIPALDELEQQYDRCRQDHLFQEELAYYLRRYCGRPTPLYLAERLTERLGGARIYLKREDLLHTGAHKINNTMGQVLLARRMGKGRVIAETGAGQHGVATATAAAMFGLACDVYMGVEDMARQELNVFRMRLLGARVIPVESGGRTLKDAINEARRLDGRPPRSSPGRPACCMAHSRTCCRTAQGRSAPHTLCRRDWTTLAWGRSTATSRTPAARSMWRCLIRMRYRVSGCWRRLRASFPRWNRLTPSRTCEHWCPP